MRVERLSRILNGRKNKWALALVALAPLLALPSFVPDYSLVGTDERPVETHSPKGKEPPLVLTELNVSSNSMKQNDRQEEPFNSPADFFLGWPTCGKELFQQECTRCHTIGRGVKVGPDLKNITAKGPREYLFNFIMNPAKYIQENHPIAVELLKHYGVKMPDLGLNRQQTLDIFAYLKAAEDEK